MGTQMTETTRTPKEMRTAPASTRRLEIASLAAELFDARGYHNTSMEDIAEAVGLRKPTLYHYFKSKDEILYEIHNEMIDLINSRHEARLAAGVESQSAALKALMGDVIELMETHPGHLRIFFEHHRELPGDYKAAIREKRARFRQYVKDAISGGIAGGEFHEVDVELTTLAVLGMANWTYQWLRPSSGRTAAEVTDSFWRLAMRGIAVDPVG
jgi:TetR/AcrR family transcriptional regulator, cholesterol catabolism regulator